MSIPGIYLTTAYRCLGDISKATTVADTQVLVLGSIANSLSGLLALGIEKEYGRDTLVDALKGVAEEFAEE